MDFIFFKTLHVLEYAILFTFLYRAILNTTELSTGQVGLVALMLTVLYAATDEIHQLFVPTREGRVTDVVFDTIGATFSWYIIWKLFPILPPKLKDLAKDWQLL